ncbi:hypothetical protein FHT81_003996 [Rhizobium sp. BK252]|nr:hypothetical protein [Rhizobium sp. BK252]
MQYDEKLQAAEKQTEGEHGLKSAPFADLMIVKRALAPAFYAQGRYLNAVMFLVTVMNEDADGFRKTGRVRVEHGIYLHIPPQA